jgi:hypothetical protein
MGDTLQDQVDVFQNPCQCSSFLQLHQYHLSRRFDQSHPFGCFQSPEQNFKCSLRIFPAMDIGGRKLNESIQYFSILSILSFLYSLPIS